jgi:NADP-dependent 3-hydroxy acid dehydrogenase YdfG
MFPVALCLLLGGRVVAALAGSPLAPVDRLSEPDRLRKRLVSAFGLANATARAIKALPADLGNSAERVNRIKFVNNAGTASVAPLLEVDIEKMEAMIDLNVTSLTLLTYAAVPGFVARGRAPHHLAALRQRRGADAMRSIR